MDENGYPTEAELERIRQWNVVKDPEGLMDFLREIWWQPEWGFKRTEHALELHTGGWSGNELIIEVLEQTMFWVFYWERSRRGGHYYFDDEMVANKWKHNE